MGLFDFGKKEKKTESKKTVKEDKIDLGPNAIVFTVKFQLFTKSKDYAKEVSNNYNKSIESAKDQKGNSKYFILKKDISTPVKLKDEEKKGIGVDGDVFAAMLEFDIGVKKKDNIFEFCFEYMPFFIEVVSPMTVSFSASELTDYLTSIQATLHKIDESLKVTNLRNQNLTKSMVRMLRNNILLALKQKSKDLKEISKNVGIDEEQLKPFVENMINDKEIKLVKNKYSVAK